MANVKLLRKHSSHIVKVGRPSTYKESFGPAFIESASRGESKTEFAASLGIDHHTLDAWAKSFPEFATALKAATTARDAWYSRFARDNLNNKQVSVGLFALAVRNICGWSDRERIIVENVPEGTLLTDAERAYIRARDKGVSEE